MVTLRWGGVGGLALGAELQRSSSRRGHGRMRWDWEEKNNKKKKKKMDN
jgi:hypothetical protein